MKIAIVDDEKNICAHLKELILEFCEKSGIFAECNLYADGNAFLSDAGHKNFDLVFLDIYMGTPNGIETAKTLRDMNLKCFIVFLTSSDAHRADAFGVHAFDYIEKPLSRNAFAQTFGDVLKMLTQKQPYLDLPIKKQTVSVLYSDILYATADSNYLVVHANEVYRCRMSFRSLSDLLSRDSRFLAINRGVLVNLDHVISMDDFTCILKDGTAFPLNKKRAAALKQAYITRQFALRIGKVSKGGNS